jgi:hypothetical protein
MPILCLDEAGRDRDAADRVLLDRLLVVTMPSRSC